MAARVYLEGPSGNGSSGLRFVTQTATLAEVLADGYLSSLEAYGDGLDSGSLAQARLETARVVVKQWVEAESGYGGEGGGAPLEVIASDGRAFDVAYLEDGVIKLRGGRFRILAA